MAPGDLPLGAPARCPALRHRAVSEPGLPWQGNQHRLHRAYGRREDRPGVGKTGLASGILLKALFAGKRGQFIKAQDLFDDMYRSIADYSSRKLLNRLIRMEVLLVDELGYLNLRPEQSNIFFKLMEERYRHRLCTLITTNLDYEEWYGFLGQKAMVGALLDRLRHRCVTLRIDGPSLRAPTG